MKYQLLAFMAVANLDACNSFVSPNLPQNQRNNLSISIQSRKDSNAEFSVEDAEDDSSRRDLMSRAGTAVAAVLSSNLSIGSHDNGLAGGFMPPVANAGFYDTAEANRISIFEKVSPSVVFIDTFTERKDAFSTNIFEVPLGTGSGFVWDNEGHIVTNFHVLRNAKTAQVAIMMPKGAAPPMPQIEGDPASFPETASSAANVLPYTSMRPSTDENGDQRSMVFKADVVGVDPTKDIAVLKVDVPKNGLTPISVGTSTGIKVGQNALAIGNPFGLDHTLTAGIISGTGREVKSPIGRPITNVIQTDAAINPGNSGGPLLDMSGKVIGMNTAIYSPSGASAGIGFAIPIDTVKLIVDTLIRDGKIVRPMLGISYLESKQAKALGITSGVLILDVPEGSAAYKAGLRGTRRAESGLIEIGDIITKIGTKAINTETDLFRALDDCKPGDEIKVTVSRVQNNEGELQLVEKVLDLTLQPSTDFEPKVSPKVYAQ